MAGLLDDLLPINLSTQGPLLPILGGGDASDASPTPEPTPISSEEDDVVTRRTTRTPANPPAQPTPEPSGDAEEEEEEQEEEEEEEEEPESSASSSASSAPPSSGSARPSTTTIIRTTLSTSILPSQINPPSSLDLPIQTSSDAESSARPTVQIPDDEELVVAPSPATPLPPKQTTVIQSVQSSANPTGTASPNAAATALSAQGDDGGDGGGLMPALPISLGIVGGVLMIGLIFGMLYRKNAWPFRGRRKQAKEFDGMDDVSEIEKMHGRKWDPRVSRTWNGNVHF